MRLAIVFVVILAMAPGTLRADAEAPAEGEAPAPSAEAPAPEASRPLESSAALGTPRPSLLPLVAFDTYGYGVDPVVPRFVVDRLRARLATRGYAVFDGHASREVAARAGLPAAPSALALERAARVAGVGRVVSSQVWAEQGRYVVQIVVVSIDGSPVVAGRVAADAKNLGPAIDALVDERVPPATDFDREAAARALAPSPSPPVAPLPTLARDDDRRPSHRGAIALIAAPAIGTGDDRFAVFHLRGRLELRVSDTFALSVIAGYANLPSGGQRAHNLPVLGQFEYKAHLADLERLRLPIRFAMGYLPYNGPIARFSAGLNLDLGQGWELGADLIAPTFLNTPTSSHLTFELALELVRRFGRVRR